MSVSLQCMEKEVVVWEKVKEMPYCPTEEEPGCLSASQALSPQLRLQLQHSSSCKEKQISPLQFKENLSLAESVLH